MNKSGFFIIVVSALLFFEASAHCQSDALDAPLRNVAIEVEFKESGREIVKAGPIGPFERRKSSEYVKQYIVVSDGLTGTIRVGEDIPYVEYYSRYLFDHGYIESYRTTFREVGTKLAVTPRIRGNSIEVSLTPQISYLKEGDRQVISVTELTTSVIVANGRSVSIGGLIKDREFEGCFLKTNSGSSLDIVLTPSIQ